jgi:hypothetical protein
LRSRATTVSWQQCVNWVKVLRPGFSSEVGRSEVLPHLLPVYLSAMDSTGQVERDLGKPAHILEVHSGPLDDDGEVASWLMELGRPVGEEELATRFVQGDHSGVTLLPTDFPRERGALWVGLSLRGLSGDFPEARGPSHQVISETGLSVVVSHLRGCSFCVEFGERGPQARGCPGVLGRCEVVVGRVWGWPLARHTRSTFEPSPDMSRRDCSSTLRSGRSTI